MPSKNEYSTSREYVLCKSSSHCFATTTTTGNILPCLSRCRWLQSWKPTPDSKLPKSRRSSYTRAASVPIFYLARTSTSTTTTTATTKRTAKSRLLEHPPRSPSTRSSSSGWPRPTCAATLTRVMSVKFFKILIWLLVHKCKKFILIKRQTFLNGEFLLLRFNYWVDIHKTFYANS